MSYRESAKPKSNVTSYIAPRNFIYYYYRFLYWLTGNSKYSLIACQLPASA